MFVLLKKLSHLKHHVSILLLCGEQCVTNYVFSLHSDDLHFIAKEKKICGEHKNK